MHQVSIWILVQANNLSNPHVIYAGQRLIIPDIKQAINGPENREQTAVAEELPSEAPVTYVVKAGDTLYRIAQNHGTTVAALAYLNGITNPSTIHAGQVLRIEGEVSTGQASQGSRKQIVVDLSEQHLYAYQDDQLLYSFVASSGAAPSYTRTGEFHVQSKIPNAYGAAWNIWMPHWLGIYWAGSSENGIHALPILSNGQTLWAGYLGTPISYGCIVLGTYEAKLLYDWAEIGTRVTIQP
jgi:LysM repeat protein